MNKICITLQKHNAELKRIISSRSGGAFSVLVTGLAGIVVLVTVFLSIIDISMYSFKKRIIAAGIDYSVSAAIQEINVEMSREGLSKAFSEDGKPSLRGVYLDENKADTAFSSTLTSNLDINIDELSSKMVRVIATPLKDSVYYSVKDKSGQISGNASGMYEIQNIMNSKMGHINAGVDTHTVYVNGNPTTNSFEDRPYYMVFIRDYEIDGLFTSRKATFISFKSAKVYR